MRRTFLLCTLSAALGALLAVGWYDPPDTERKTLAQEPGRRWQPRLAGGSAVAPPANSPDNSELTAEERVNVAVYENTNRSAVNISTLNIETDRFFLLERTSRGQGSGTLIDRQGHVLTNYHVVEGSPKIEVTLYNGRSFAAEVVGGDPATDVAVLKIDAPVEDLFPVTFGSSTGLKVGQRVFAIGNPFGLERTLSTGIISSLNRALPRRHGGGKIKSIIQIDAAINPGSSGGPLLDSRGRMIGMNTAIASTTGESAGVGFAIPVNTILRVVPQLIEDGRVVRADIGIELVSPMEQGLLIAQLTRGGAAAKAGLKGPRIVRRQRRFGPFVDESWGIDRSAADLILAIDGTRVHTVDDLLTIIESKKPGVEVLVTVIRAGKQQRVPVRLEAEK